MKNTRKPTSSAALLAALFLTSSALAQRPPAGDADSQIRPTDAPPTPINVSPSDGLRGSLFEQGADAAVPINVDGQNTLSAPVSFTAVQPPIPHKFKKNDLVTVIVEEDSGYTSSAEGKSQKQQAYDLAIQQFIQLAASASGVPSVGVVGQPSKLPEIKFNYNNNRDNQASQTRTDSFTVRIAATVVDVKPNGNCVIEADKSITVDKEIQTFRLSGVCRAADITPDNTVLSTQLASLTVSKNTGGEVREGIKSGWLNKLIDKYNPL
jgi:flagellar L-ring protein FlgH